MWNHIMFFNVSFLLNGRSHQIAYCMALKWQTDHMHTDTLLHTYLQTGLCVLIDASVPKATDTAMQWLLVKKTPSTLTALLFKYTSHLQYSWRSSHVWLIISLYYKFTHHHKLWGSEVPQSLWESRKLAGLSHPCVCRFVNGVLCRTTIKKKVFFH